MNNPTSHILWFDDKIWVTIAKDQNTLLESSRIYTEDNLTVIYSWWEKHGCNIRKHCYSFTDYNQYTYFVLKYGI